MTLLLIDTLGILWYKWTMTSIAIDAHKIVKRLKDAGFAEPQAEVFTDILVENTDSNLKASASKADLIEATAPLKADISLLKWMVGTLLAINIAIAVKLLMG